MHKTKLSRAALEDSVKEIVQKHARKRVPAIKEHTHLLRDLGIGGEQIAFLMLNLERRFKKRLDREAFSRARTVGDLIDIVCYAN